jgi:hypothetical protein
MTGGPSPLEGSGRVKAQRTPLERRHPMARLELTLVTGGVLQYKFPKETEADSLTVELLETTGLFEEKWLKVDDRTLINTECVAGVPQLVGI